MNQPVVSSDGKDVPKLTPEEMEKARKAFLLGRFLKSARGYWGPSGEKVAWLCTLALLLLIVSNLAFQYLSLIHI